MASLISSDHCNVFFEKSFVCNLEVSVQLFNVEFSINSFRNQMFVCRLMVLVDVKKIVTKVRGTRYDLNED